LDIETLLNFLALISIPIGVFYHIMTLNNTRKSQELAQKAREAQVFLQFSNRMADDQFLQGLTDLSEGKAPQMRENVNIQKIYMSFEDLGGLVRGGYLGIPIIAYTTTGPVKLAWESIAPRIDEIREKTQNPRMWSELEYLYNELMKFHKEHPELAG
jgi:hypothetical protein